MCLRAVDFWLRHGNWLHARLNNEAVIQLGRRKDTTERCIRRWQLYLFVITIIIAMLAEFCFKLNDSSNLLPCIRTNPAEGNMQCLRTSIVFHLAEAIAFSDYHRVFESFLRIQALPVRAFIQTSASLIASTYP